MKARNTIVVLVAAVALLVGFQNCSPGAGFSAASSEQSSVAERLTLPTEDSSESAAGLVVTCSDKYYTGEMGVCLEYNGYTPEEYGVNNCTNAQLTKGYTPCPRTSLLVGRCGSAINGLAGNKTVYTYKYVPSYADENQRGIMTDEFATNCKISGTWEPLN